MRRLRSGKKTVSRAGDEIKKEEILDRAKTVKLNYTDKTYDAIVVDPPWPSADLPKKVHFLSSRFPAIYHIRKPHHICQYVTH